MASHDSFDTCWGTFVSAAVLLRLIPLSVLSLYCILFEFVMKQDRVTTGARSRQPFQMLNVCGEALALTIRREGKDEIRFTLEDGGGK